MAIRETGPTYGSGRPHIRYAQEWYERAERDLARVGTLLQAFDAEGAAFFLQQALEKFLKAFLITKGWRLQRTHNIEGLLVEAAYYDQALLSYQSLCKRIGKYYIETRYPDFGPLMLTEEYVQLDLDDAQGLIQKLRL